MLKNFYALTQKKTLFQSVNSTLLNFKLLATLALGLACFGSYAQTRGTIYKPATLIGGVSVLNPSKNGFTSATSAGWTSGGVDYGSASELKMIPIPRVGAEPVADLSTGASGGHTDIVGNDQSVYVLNDGTNLIIRFRIGKNSSASKGYTLLIDTDEKFGPGDTDSYNTTNMGFEREVTLQTNFGVKVFGYTLGGSSTIASYSEDDHHQRSIAATNNNSDPDYFYDFFVPLTDIVSGGSASTAKLRFAATSVTSAQSGTSGTVSDINGITDSQYGGNTFAALATAINSFPATTVSGMVEGSTFTASLSNAPVITASIATNSTTVSGTSIEANGTTIKIYRKVGAGSYTQVGTTTVSGNIWSWTISGLSPTLAANDLFYATATAGSNSESLASNIVTVTAAQTCYLAPPVLGARSNGGARNIAVSWTWPSGVTPAAGVVQIRLYQQTTPTTFTEITGGGATQYLAADGTLSFLLGSPNGNITGVYYATATYNGCTSGYSLASTGSGDVPTTAPSITTLSVNASTSSTSITVKNNFSGTATLILYVNGIEKERISNISAGASTNFTGNTGFITGDILSARAIGTANTNYLSDLSNVVTVTSAGATQANAPVIVGNYYAGSGKTVSGTSVEQSGSTITLYSGSTVIGTTTVNNFGNWSVTGLTLTNTDVLTAKVLPLGKSLSPASNSVNVFSAATAPAAPTVTSPIMAGATSVSGTGGVGTVTVYVDGSAIGTASGSSWTLSGVSNELFKGGVVTATNTDNSSLLTSVSSNSVTITGPDNFLIEAAAGGALATQTAGVAFPVKITARTAANATFPNYTGKNVISSASFVSAGGGPTASFVSGILSSHDVTLTTAGTYTLGLNTLSTTDPTLFGSTSVTVVHGPSREIAIQTQPSTNATSGTNFTTQPVIYVYDAYGNLANTDNTTQVTVSIASGTGLLNGTKTLTAVNGVITFAGLNIIGTGAHTLKFSTVLNSTTKEVTSNTITLPALTNATSVALTGPSSVTAGSVTTAFTLQAKDGSNSGVVTQNTVYSLSSNSTGTTTFYSDAAGTAVITSVTITNGTSAVNLYYKDTKSGTPTITATRVSGDALGNTTANITVNASTATKVAFSVEPSNAVAGVSISPSVQVTIQDTFGNTVTGSTAQVTLAISNNPNSGTLSGTAAVNAVTGIATFTGISINKVGTGYTLAASSTGLTGATSAGFNITVAAASNIAIASGNNQTGQTGALLSNFTVLVTDAFGNPVSGTPVTFAIATEPGGATGTSINPSTAINTNASGNASAALTLGNTAGTYTTTATSTGLTGSPLTFTATASNSLPAPAISYTTPNTYTRGTAITNLTPTSSGGTVASYSVSPTLPTGLSLNTTTGVISGTPTAVTGTATYTVTATNATSSTTFDVVITVNDVAPSALSYTTPNVYTRGTAITSLFPTVTGNVVSYSVSPSLPAGLHFNGTNGVISGTPTAVTAIANYTVTATNTGGSTTFDVSITVNDIAPSALSYTTPNVYTRGTAITSLSPTVTGNVVSYSVSPTLPAGLSLNTTTGVISGTPTAVTGIATYTVTATNSGGSTTFGVSITVNDIAPSALSYTTPNVYTRGTAITSLSPTVTGNVVSYSVSPALPAGLSLNTTTGVISGTPTTVTGIATYTVTATNSGGSTTFGVSITVNDIAPSALSYTTPNVYTRGTAITSLSPTVTGNVVSYSVSPALPAGLSLNTTTGVISGTPTAVTGIATYTVTATNSGGSTTFGVSITVNDIAPSALSYTTPNVYTRGTAITSLSPTVTGNVVSYSVSPTLPAGLSLNTTTGVISGTPTAVTVIANYTVTATNTGGSTTFDVSITVNDVAPSALSYTTPNVYTRGTAITSLSPTVAGNVVSYSVSPSLPAGLSLNTTTGVISGTPTAVTGIATYTVTATNSGGSTTFGVSITVNDVAPSSLSYTTPNVYTRGTAITSLSPTVTGNVVSYSVSPSLPTGLSLNTTTGVISGTPTAVTGIATYTVTATNTGGSTTFDVSITVNDVAPSALSYTTPNVYTKGTAITSLSPTVTGNVVSYSVSPSLPAGLSLNTTTGVISGTPTAVTAIANYTVTATNTGGSTTFDVSITVNDVAPSALSYTTPNVYTRGTAITSLSPAVTGNVVSYSVSPALPAGLSLNTTTGVISGTPTAVTAIANYTVTATNSGGSTTFGVSITVNDVAPSALSYTTPNVYTKGTAIVSLSPTVTGNVVSYSVSPSLPAGLSLNTTTGVISGTPTAVTGIATYTVTATNSGGSTTFSVSITVNDVAPSALSYTTPNVYTRGTAITSLSPTVTGNVVSYSVSPALPAGLSLNTTTGVISGTPTAVTAIANYTVTATNTGGSTTFGVSITVNDVAPSALSYTTPNVYTRGTAITSLSPTVTGNVVSYSVSPALPAGLSLNTTTGVISGTPTAVTGIATYTVTATNSGGSTTFGVSITVNDIAPSALSYTTPNVYTRGTAITSLSPTVTGNVVSYSVSPSLPTGLSLNTTTGVISGTPTAVTGIATYTVTATNSGGSTTFGVSITVNDVAPSALSYTTPNVYTRGTAITTLSPTVTGNVVSYSVSPTLPAGLSLNTTTGVISGTPTAVTGIATYTVTATNSGGSTTFDVSITVNDVAPSALSYTTPNVYTRGTAITSLSPTVTGNVVSYSVSPSLPAGLSLNTTTGVISGTPTTVTAIANYTVTATNTGGSTTFDVSITVNDVAPSALSYTTPNVYTRGTAITSLSPTVTGNVVSYSVSPSLPVGLSLNTTTGVISGTPTAVTAIANYTVTATNTGGSTTFGVSITVNDVAPSALSYTTPNVYTRGTAITSLSPTVTGNVVSYSVSPTLPAGLSLNTTTGVISGTPTAVTAIANYTVTATNSGGSTTFGVSITVNDVAPSALSYTTPNVYTRGTAITSLSPTVTGNVVSYSVSPALPTGLSLNTTTGVISGTPTAVTAIANYTVTATNTGGSTTFDVSITVNDVAPSALSYTTPNIYTRGTAITSLSPTVTGNVVSYSMSPSLPAGLSLNTTTGVISGTPTTVTAIANYTVTATNTGGSTTFGVSITVNDVAPSALSYTTPNVYTRGTAIISLSPTVTGNVVSYSVSPTLPAGLSLNTTTGVISGTPTTVTGIATYTVTATNSGGSTTFGVSITVNDVAPSALSYTTPNVYTRGTPITTLSPTVTGNVVSYSVSPALPAGLSLNTTTGVISGTPTAVTGIATYTVTATNSGGSTTFGVSITVNDIAPSALSYTTPNVYTRGTAITSLSPTVTGNVVSYYVSPSLPTGLSLNTTTGVISGTPTAVTAIANYTVTATNTGGSTTFDVSITVNDVAPSALSYTTPNVYTRGTAITSLSPTVTGNVVSYSVSPALPAGLSLNTTTGVISGTPTAVTGIATYTVTATNSGGSTTFGVSITVNDIAPSALSYTTPNVYTRGTAITSLSPTVTGNVVSYSVSPSLPTGLSLNTTTGVISGTPTAVTGIATYTVTATNSGGSTTFGVSITVNDVAPSALSYTTPNVYTRGTAITTLSPTVTGNVVSYSVSPTLPAGLSLNTTTGVISGTPTAVTGIATYTVTATNSGGSTTFDVSITVNDVAPSALSYTTPNVYTRGTAITSLSPTVTGNVVSYSVSPSLPAGLSLNTTTGVISGTPTAVTGIATYTVTATNSGGSTTFGVSITVNDIAPSALSYTTPNVYTRGTAITSLSPTVTGNVVSYSVSPSLPAGLSLNTTTGVISGTPTAVTAIANYAVTATNTGGSTTFDVSITVNDIAPSALSYTTPNVYTRGTTITSLSPTVTGNVVSYSVSPTLPAGLSLNATTGVISGTPTAVTGIATYTVTTTNSGGSTTFGVSITVNDVAPSALSYTTPNVYTRGTAITSLSPTVTGNVVSYSVSPSLPAGLSLNTTTGVISGTPTAVTAIANYTVTATNSGGSTTFGVSITVNDIAPSALAYNSPNVLTVGTAITPLVPTSNGGPATSYSISPGLPAGLSFNTTTGVISGTPTTVTGTATYTVTATNSGGSVTYPVVITVNDVAPSALSYTTPNVYTKGTAIVSLSPTVTGNVVSYSVSPSLPAGLSLNTTTGVISGTPSAVTAIANYTVTATNSGGSTTFGVSITVNDIAPSALAYNSPNVLTVGTAITPLVPTSNGGPATSYSVSPGLPAGLSFNTTTGVISGTPTAVSGTATYTVTATNSGGSVTFPVVITVNDVAPSALSYTTPNVYTRGTAITSLSPTATGNVVSYSVSPALPAGLSLNTTTGVISGTPTAVTGIATYTVTATNSGGSTTFGVSITVNDIAPSALAYNSPNVLTVGTAITPLAPSSNGGPATSYSVSPGLPAGLSFNTTTGVISGTPTTVTGTATYTVTATNSGGSVTFPVVITVNDVAPSALSYTTPNVYTRGTAITSLSPTVTGNIVSYSVSPALPAGLSLNTTTGVISGTPSAVTGTATYTVTATNSGGSTTFGVSITVNDVAPSALAYNSPNVLTVGTAITPLVPTSNGGPATSYSVSPGLPAGLSFNTTTGVISGTPTTVSGTATYTVTATNSGGSVTFPVVITVNDVAPSALSYTTPNVYTRGTAITSLLPTVTGNVVTYSVSPSLPAGLSLNTTTGVISGTPSAVTAIANYTVTATNSGGSTTFGVSITVNDVAPSALAYNSPNVLTVGTAITPLVPTSNGGPATSYSVSPGLPAGLSFNTTTGVISGTPTTVSGTATYTVTATNSGGSVTFPVVITVNDVAPSALSYTTPNVYTRGTAITSLLPTVTGNVVSYSVSPSLPTGLSLNTTTGVISGTPTAVTGIATYTVTATNSGGSKTFGVSITVNDIAPSALSYTSPNLFVVGSSVTSIFPTVTGNVTSYSVSPGLPAGLSFNTTTGAISGTPTTQTGTATYTVTASNSGGSVSFPVVVTVNDVLKLNLVSKTDVTINSQNTGSVTLGATGGATGYQFSKDGINFQSSPTFTGLTAGTYTFTVKDASGKTATFIVTITQPLVLTATTTAKVDVLCYGSATGSFTVNATGGTTPYGYSIGAGNTNYVTTNTFNSLLAGNYVVNVIDAAGSKHTLNVTITQPASAFTVTVTGKNIICAGTSTVLTSTTAASYQWYLNGTPINGAINATYTANQTGAYFVIAKNANNCQAVSNQFNLTVDALPVVTVSADKSSLVRGAAVTLTATGGTTYEWSPKLGLNNASGSVISVKPLVTTTYTVTAFNANGCSSIAQITIEVKDDYVLPNVFSPNGDGINDYWVIENVKDLPDHTLRIFDRAGRTLYSIKNYNNTWDGRVNGHLLEEGTYYYTIQFTDNKLVTRKGFITIVR